MGLLAFYLEDICSGTQTDTFYLEASSSSYILPSISFCSQFDKNYRKAICRRLYLDKDKLFQSYKVHRNLDFVYYQVTQAFAIQIAHRKHD